MQIPEREPEPADIAALNVFSTNLDDVNGAINAVQEATGWSVAEVSGYIIDNLAWLRGAADTVALLDLTGWSEAEVRAYLTNVTGPQALRLAAMRAQRLADPERRRSDIYAADAGSE